MKQILLFFFCTLITASTNPIIAQPGGTSCASAVAVTPGDYQCDHAGGVDQWYSYTAPEEQKVTASTCGLTDVDTYVEIGELCGAALASSDNDCGGQSSVEIPVVAGQAYGITWRSKSGLTSFPWTLSITTDIVDVSSQSNVIIVYPNPNDGNFTISSNSKENFKSVEILTTTGILVTTLNAEIECSHTYSVKLQSGIYIVRITLENNSKLSTKLIVK